MTVVNFPWDYYLDKDKKEIWVHIPGGYPSTLTSQPLAIERCFPGYKGKLCSQSTLKTLKDNEQKTSN